MDLRIEIPVHSHNSSPICAPPLAPMAGINDSNYDNSYHRHFFDWGINRCEDNDNFQSYKYPYQYNKNNDNYENDENNINDLYQEVEDFIYFIDHKDKKAYKSHFQDNTRILIKRVSVNNEIKRLYLLTKNYDLWFRSHIDLLHSEQDAKYYDMQWK